MKNKIYLKVVTRPSSYGIEEHMEIFEGDIKEDRKQYDNHTYCWFKVRYFELKEVVK